jgi:hypothetical protein
LQLTDLGEGWVCAQQALAKPVQGFAQMLIAPDVSQGLATDVVILGRHDFKRWAYFSEKSGGKNPIGQRPWPYEFCLLEQLEQQACHGQHDGHFGEHHVDGNPGGPSA